MRKVGALCLFLVAAHQGWSQTRSIEQQMKMWSDFSATLTGPDLAERHIVASPANESYPYGDRITVAELRHKTPGKAMTAFFHGVKFAAAGDFSRAAKDFQHAVTIDPEYADAHGNLGVMYVELGILDEAAGEFRRAVELDPASSSHHANLALALILLKLPGEAQAEAQTAVGLDRANPKARYLLGCLLARRPETRSSAVEHLTYAAQQVPEAHLALADLYRQEGADALARMEQDRYRKATLESVKAP
jgi:tetratricopeptide (TPR) repeat protein